MSKRALLVATDRYDDEGLRRLTAPAADAAALGRVLSRADIAGFDVTLLVNEPHHVVGKAISALYRGSGRGDLALLYFTGHGLKDDAGRLYLATTNTHRDSLLFTALSGQQISDAMEDCPSRQKVLILDCCYSGAFPAGQIAKGDTEVHTLDRFQGKGRVVLTASDATQYSFEGDRVTGTGAGSVFTRYLVEGIETGRADLDADGDIALDELYSYVHDRVTEEMPQQRPKKQENIEGRIVIGRNIHWTVPAYIGNAIDSPIARDRLSAVEGLRRLHRSGNSTVRGAARNLLLRLVDDDSKSVSAAAADAVAAIEGPPAAPVAVTPPPPSPPPPPPPQEEAATPPRSAPRQPAGPDHLTEEQRSRVEMLQRRMRILAEAQAWHSVLRLGQDLAVIDPRAADVDGLLERARRAVADEDAKSWAADTRPAPVEAQWSWANFFFVIAVAAVVVLIMAVLTP